MRTLSSLLELDEQSRLTTVLLLPLSHQLSGTAGSIVMNVATGSSDSAGVGGAAVSRHLHNAIAVIGGVQGNGGDWFATFEHAAFHDPATLHELSRAGVIRALDLTGVGTFTLRTADFDWADLCELYRDSGCRPVDEWSIVDLFLGTVINLWRGDLPGVVEDLSSDHLTGDTAAVHRRTQIHAALSDWSATFEGPERP